MSWSLGETAALALKATRGAGMSWGLAEETAAAVVWLHRHGLPGMSALCSYLGGGDIFQDAEPACPIVTGCALIDGLLDIPETPEQTREIGEVRAPLLLLPFVARLEPGTLWLIAPGFAGTTGPQGSDSWQSHCLRGVAHCQIAFRDRPQIDPSLEKASRLGDHFACCVDRLNAFALRTYAPATGASRMSGAGAGLTDND